MDLKGSVFSPLGGAKNNQQIQRDNKTNFKVEQMTKNSNFNFLRNSLLSAFCPQQEPKY